jgi:ethanolamine utilization protein
MMDKQNLQQLVERIARELLQKEPPRKKVLFIFCDSSAHEPYRDQLLFLLNKQIDHDLLFLDGETSGWLGIQQIQSTGAKQIIAADEYAKAPLELPHDYDAIVIPEIDLDNAARVCQGLKGSVKAEIIFSALVLGKPVLIGKESPGLKRADRQTLRAMELPTVYRKKFENYMREMGELGVRFSKQGNLHKEIRNLLFGENLEDSKATLICQEKVVTAEWLARNLINYEELMVREGAIITPLAKDYIRVKGIEIKVVGKEGSA